MKRVKGYLVVSCFLALWSCKTTKDIVPVTVDYETELLDTLVVTAPAIVEDDYSELPTYRASAKRTHDLIHTKLEVSFDWKKQHVLGKAQLDLKPMFYSTDLLELDAKVFDIHSIKMNGKELQYNYDNYKLAITLDKEYSRDETYRIFIDYTAKPNEGPSGGSQAIQSDKGLFFINPESQNKFKPQQIWTQGETENSSRWFPTIDKPNERCSQEVYITVADKFKTLSNGKFVSSTKNADGTRTDYWKQVKPHAPYLFMLGIGDYAVVTDKWNGKDLLYYVEPAYKEHAEQIFNHTPEMLTFFSDILDYPYPWDKYAQIVCRDYVSGAMENTGAVVFGDPVQKTSRELLDGNNDDIVAHEMIHHWFGDLVTCESWSNLTLNEGFATYGEYLWQEYKYGHEAAERKRLQDLNGYIMTADRGGTHDLIDFGFDDKEDMFDGHSYNKGGLIVHMLRSYVGDDAFFASLNRYLTQHEYTDVEAHELRMAFEDVTGEDLNWFFNQWFFSKGHPQLDVVYDIDKEVNKVFIDVAQTQDPYDNVEIFQLPFQAALYYASGKVVFVDLFMNQREQLFEIEVTGDEMPVVVVLDGAHDVLGTYYEERTEKDYANLFRLSPEYEDKYISLTKLKGKSESQKLILDAVEDPSEEIRLMGINALAVKRDSVVLADLALNDESSLVRSTSLKKLKSNTIALKSLEQDQSFRVLSVALDIVNKQNPEEGLRQANLLTNTYHKPLIGAIGDIFSKSKKTEYLEFFEQHLNKVSMFGFFNFISQYGKLAKQADAARIEKTAGYLKDIAMEGTSAYFKKYSSANLIETLRKDLHKKFSDTDPQVIKARNTLANYMSQIVNSTNDTRLRNAFGQYIENP